MNWKLIIVGGIVFYAAQWVVGMATGVFIHNGVLHAYYLETAQFWRPELNQVPRDMAALLPRWIATGLIASFLSVFVYGWGRPALSGGGWVQGPKFRVGAVVFTA